MLSCAACCVPGVMSECHNDACIRHECGNLRLISNCTKCCDDKTFVVGLAADRIQLLPNDADTLIEASSRHLLLEHNQSICLVYSIAMSLQCISVLECRDQRSVAQRGLEIQVVSSKEPGTAKSAGVIATEFFLLLQRFARVGLLCDGRPSQSAFLSSRLHCVKCQI